VILSATVLDARGLRKVYETGGGSVVALDGVDVGVDPGAFVGVMGPSGSGKTTLLNVLGLLDAPTAGTIRLDGREVTGLSERERTRARKRTIGFVFQDFHLLGTLSARENVLVPRLFERDRREERAVDLLERVGLGDRLDHAPDELSGGQKQRVAIARSLINDPRIVLADEPTGNLDRATSRRVLEALEAARERGVSVVTVTHDPLVREYVDRTVELVDGRLRA
jgi:putative ABC transport system ATP-binding protein